MAHGLQSGLRDGGLSRGGLHAGLGNGSIFNIASLDLNFAKYKNIGSLVTFTRASSGTFVGSNGVLQSAVTNLLLRSEEIGTSPWGTNTSGSVTYTANATAAPTGAVTADRVTATADFAGPNQFISAVSGLNYGFSFYIKAVTPGALDLIRIECFLGRFAQFNITTRAFSGVNAAITPSSILVGDGWVRVQMLFAAPSTGSLAVAIYANTSSDFYLWGAQLEQAATTGEYIPTTSTINSAPRFDHNPTTGESLGLLVEEQRTNSITNNTMVGAVAGTPGTSPTGWLFVSAPGGITREIIGVGTESGINYIDYRFSGTTTNANGVNIAPGNGAALTGQTWNASTYWKLAGGSTAGVSTFAIGIIEETSASVFIAGAFYGQTASTSAPLISQRPTATRTLTGGATVAQVRHTIQFSIPTSTAIDFTIRIGLPQLELGAFATSPILTSTAAATRSADVASITGSAFTGFYRQNEGTVFSSGDFVKAGATSFSRIVSLAGANTGIDEISLYTRISVGAGDGTIFGAVTVNSSLEADLNAPTFQPDLSGSYRSAIAYKANDFGLSSNGLAPTADTSGTLPPITQLIMMGNVRFQNRLSGHLRRICYWPQRLGNQVLQRITQ